METNQDQAMQVKDPPRIKLPKDAAPAASAEAEPKKVAKRGLDPELAVIRDITRKIEALEPDAQDRVVSYVMTRYAGPKH